MEETLRKVNQPNLYLNRDPRNRIKDGEPRALYWWNYRQTFEKYKGSLRTGEEVDINLPILLMGNNILQPFHFDLKKKDRMRIENCVLPGKSAHIAFTDNIHEASGALFDKDSKRQDHLYILPSGKELAEIGYYVCYLPTPNQPLHVRLVHQSQIDDSDLEQPPFKYRKMAAELFNRYKVI